MLTRGKSAGRMIDKEHYINVDWFFEHMYDTCHICNNDIPFKITKKKVETDFTADRLCNFRDHSIDNCKAACNTCNCAKK